MGPTTALDQLWQCFSHFTLSPSLSVCSLNTSKHFLISTQPSTNSQETGNPVLLPITFLRMHFWEQVYTDAGIVHFQPLSQVFAALTSIRQGL